MTVQLLPVLIAIQAFFFLRILRKKIVVCSKGSWQSEVSGDCEPLTERWQKCFLGHPQEPKLQLSQHDWVWAGLQSTAVGPRAVTKAPVSEGCCSLSAAYGPPLSACQPSVTPCSEWSHPFSPSRKLVRKTQRLAQWQTAKRRDSNPALLTPGPPSGAVSGWSSRQDKGPGAGGCGK